MRKEPDNTIFYGGTNELILDRTSQDITTFIVNQAYSLKDVNCDVSISNIILRTDNKKLIQKGQGVNTHLKELSKEKSISLIDNANKIKVQHLNKGKLYLNKRGLLLLVNYLGF